MSMNHHVTMTRAFLYRQLKDGEVRVINLKPGVGIERISGSLEVINVKDSVPGQYSALSYCWGPESQPRSLAFLDDQAFEVRQNLFEALQHLRYPDRPRRLWIDAICINQDDNDEKKMQIPLMSLVYARAATVEIWLGTAEDDGEPGLKYLASKNVEASATVEKVCAVIDLLQRPWFSRVWVMQELILSAPNAAYVNCGTARVPWDSFSDGMMELVSSNCLQTAFHRGLSPQATDAQRMVPSPPHLSSIQASILRNLLSNVVGTHGMSIMMLCGLRKVQSSRMAESKPKLTTSTGAVLRNSRYATATVPKDKLYGICGLLNESVADELIKSYQKTAEEAFFAATLQILRHDIHPNLYHEYPTISHEKATEYNVPSWTLDLSFTGITYAELRFTSFTKFAAARQPQDKLLFADDGRRMAVNVRIVDTIAHVLESKSTAQVPKNVEGWKLYAERLYKAAKNSSTPPEPNWQDRANAQQFADKVNVITFLEGAYSLYREHCTRPTDTGSSIPFFETLLSGLLVDHGKGTPMQLPTGRQLEEHGNILLGHLTLAASAPPDLHKMDRLTAQGLDLRDPDVAAATVRRVACAPAP